MLNGLSLIEIEKILQSKIVSCEIVSDLKLSNEEFTYLESKFRDSFKIIDDDVILRSYISTFEVSITVLLVYEALYKYKKSYWDSILVLINKDTLNENDIKGAFVDSFNNTIAKYKLKNFSDVGGYKNVTPIICHSGIPNSSLNTLFEITNQFMNESDIGPEEIIENIKYFIKYRVEKSIYRFITTNEDRAKEFIYDLQILIRDIENYDYSYEDTIEKFDFIDIRILDAYFVYKNTISDVDKLKNKHKKYLIQPKLILNRYTESLSVKFPANKIKNGYDDTVEWIIITDNKEERIKCSIYGECSEFITEEKIVQLLPSKKYEFKLMYDGDILGKWEYRGFSDEEPFLLFDSNFNLIKSNRVIDENIYFLCESKCDIERRKINSRDLNITEKGWLNYKGYEINFKEKIQDIPVYIDGEFIAFIKHRNKNNIKLTGDSEIFKVMFTESYVPIFSEIAPKITIDNIVSIDNSYYMTIRNLKHNINLKLPLQLDLIGKDKIVSLDNIECFKDEIYGEYDIRIYSGKKLVKILPFKFIQFIKVSNLIWEKYPSEKGVYRKQRFKVVCDENIEVKFNDLEEEVVLSTEKQRELYFNNYKASHFINGNLEMNFMNKLYNFPIKKKSRSICYSIINEGEELLEFKTERTRIFIKELEDSNKNLVLSFMDEYNESFKIQCILEADNGVGLQVHNTVSINSKMMYLALNQFYDTIKKSTLSRFNIRVIIKNINENIICNYVPCVIKEEVLISNVNYSEIDNGNIMLNWTGEGLNVNNELVLKIYDLLQPWKEPMSININTNLLTVNNNRFTIYLDKEAYSLKNGTIYYFEINEDKDELYENPDRSNKVLIFKEEGLYLLNVKSGINRCIDMKSLISHVIKATKKEELEELIEKIKAVKVSNLSERVDEDIVKGLYFLHVNCKEFLKIDKEATGIKYKCIYTLCMKYFNKYNIYTLLDILLSYDKYENVKSLLDIINIINLDINIEENVNKENRDKVWQYDKERAFLIETRSGISSKSISIRNIFELVGESLESEILGYSIECDKCKYKGNKGCVSKFIKRRCNKRTVNISEELIGSSGLYGILFEEYNTRLNQKALQSLNWIKDTSGTGIVVLEDTYVNSVFKWVEGSNLEKREKMSKKIIEHIDIINGIIKKITMNNEFIEMHKYLKKRKENNKKSPNTLAYYNGVIVLISSMIKYKRLDGLITNIESRAILRLLVLFRKNMYEIYLRDLIIIEFYLMQGEDLYVDGSN